MDYIKIIQSLIIAIGLFASVEAAPLDGSDLQQLKTPSAFPQVVMVGGVCSGFVAKKNIVLTAAHCVRKNTAWVDVELDVETHRPFEILFVGEEMTRTDYAILQGDTGEIPPLSLASRLPADGELVLQAGLSEIRDQQFSTYGVYINDEGELGLSFALFLLGGDSGSPIMSAYHEVLAIHWGSTVVFNLFGRPTPTPHAYAVPIVDVVKKMEEIGV